MKSLSAFVAALAVVSLFVSCSAEIKTSPQLDPVPQPTVSAIPQGDLLTVSPEDGDGVNRVSVTSAGSGPFVKALKYQRASDATLEFQTYSIAAQGCDLSGVVVKIFFGQAKSDTEIDQSTLVELTPGKTVDVLANKKYGLILTVTGMGSCPSANVVMKLNKL